MIKVDKADEYVVGYDNYLDAVDEHLVNKNHLVMTPFERNCVSSSLARYVAMSCGEVDASEMVKTAVSSFQEIRE